MTSPSTRWAWAEIDLEAIAHNVRIVSAAAAPAAVWAVVKADAYGHGAVGVAETVISAGAGGLCVALVQEGVELRNAGNDARILVLTEQPPDQIHDAVRHGLTPTVSSLTGVAAAAAAAGRETMPVAVHLKVDTGMHRSGAEPSEAVALADAVKASGSLVVEGVFTHLARADEPAAPSNEQQLLRFHDVLGWLREAGHSPRLVHAANSAGALALPASRFGMVRAGIALYGIEPGPGVRDLCEGLRPALSLQARISRVHRVRAGEGISYGHTHRFTRESIVATVPIGYADGVARRLSATGGEVLVAGRRAPIIGVVTMDQLMLDCTDIAADVDVRVGDHVVLIGTQCGRRGSDSITVEEWAERLGTIGYEVVCDVSARIQRRPRLETGPPGASPFDDRPRDNR